MNMLIKFIALILITSTTLLANNKPSEGTLLQVNAPSGLKLRVEPTLQSTVLDIMPYGSFVSLQEFESFNVVDRVEWNDGNWIKVNYNGIQGWAFDGFLTAFEVPQGKLETVYEDMDFLYPVEFWIRSQFPATAIDTVEHLGEEITTKYAFKNGSSMTISDYDSVSTLEVTIKDARVMEIYQILTSMIASKNGVEVFKKSTIFIERDGSINLVKVDTDNPIQIRKIGQNKVKVSIISHMKGC